MRKQKYVRHWTVSRNIQFKKLSNTQKSIANFKQDFLSFSYYSWLNSFVTVPFPSLIRGWLLLDYVNKKDSIKSDRAGWSACRRTSKVAASPVLGHQSRHITDWTVSEEPSAHSSHLSQGLSSSLLTESLLSIITRLGPVHVSVFYHFYRFGFYWHSPERWWGPNWEFWLRKLQSSGSFGNFVISQIVKNVNRKVCGHLSIGWLAHWHWKAPAYVLSHIFDLKFWFPSKSYLTPSANYSWLPQCQAEPLWGGVALDLF